MKLRLKIDVHRVNKLDMKVSITPVHNTMHFHSNNHNLRIREEDFLSLGSIIIVVFRERKAVE